MKKQPKLGSEKQFVREVSRTRDVSQLRSTRDRDQVPKEKIFVNGARPSRKTAARHNLNRYFFNSKGIMLLFLV
jgi:hypothetical protein